MRYSFHLWHSKPISFEMGEMGVKRINLIHEFRLVLLCFKILVEIGTNIVRLVLILKTVLVMF